MKKVIFTTLFPIYLLSQDLSGLIESSLENQLVESSSYNIESVKNRLESTKNGYMPKITLNASYSNTNEETALNPDSSLVSNLNISYIVYDGGKKYDRVDALKENIKSGNANLNSLKNQISLQVINYYFNYLSLVSSKEAKQKEIETLKAQQKRLERFYNAGTATSDEVDKIVSRVQRANVVLHEIELDIQRILHNLEYITSKDVSITQGSKVSKIDGMEDKGLRSDLRALEHDMGAKLKMAKSEKSSNYPTVSIENTYTHYEMEYKNKAYDQNMEDQNIFKVNFSWKLYDFGSANDAYESSYKEYQGIKSRYEYEKNKVNVDLKLSIKAYEIAKLKIGSATSALKAANSTYETIEAKYHNGLVDNVAYLDALSEKYSAASALKSAKYDLEIKKADIIYHSGKNLWEYIK